jgi:hypothetical protein
VCRLSRAHSKKRPAGVHRITPLDESHIAFQRRNL